MGFPVTDIVTAISNARNNSLGDRRHTHKSIEEPAKRALWCVYRTWPYKSKRRPQTQHVDRCIDQEIDRRMKAINTNNNVDYRRRSIQVIQLSSNLVLALLYLTSQQRVGHATDHAKMFGTCPKSPQLDALVQSYTQLLTTRRQPHLL